MAMKIDILGEFLIIIMSEKSMKQILYRYRSERNIPK